MFYFYFIIVKDFSQWKKIHIQILSNDLYSVMYMQMLNQFDMKQKKKSNLTFFISKKKIVKKKTVKLFFWDILTHIIKTNINNEHRNVTKYFIENIFKKIFISSTTFYNEYFF